MTSQALQKNRCRKTSPLQQGVCTSACLLPRSLRCPAASSSVLLAPGLQPCLLQISKFKLAFMNSLLSICKLWSNSVYQPELDSAECVRYAGSDWSAGSCGCIREENASFLYEFFGLMFVLVSWFCC